MASISPQRQQLLQPFGISVCTIHMQFMWEHFAIDLVQLQVAKHISPLSIGINLFSFIQALLRIQLQTWQSIAKQCVRQNNAER